MNQKLSPTEEAMYEFAIRQLEKVIYSRAIKPKEMAIKLVEALKLKLNGRSQ